VFDAAYLRVLTDVAEQVLPGRHQRRIMDGGTCEAAAATAWGLPAIGISVPLGNYHNEHFAAVGRSGQTRPAATGAPAPEYVHLDDIDGLLKLCRGLLRPGLDWQDPWRVQRHRLRQNRRRYQSLLRPGRGH
jgi:endoglucanase